MTDAKKRPSRFWLYAPFFVVGLIFACYGLLWRAGAAHMKTAVADWVAEQRAAGFEVEHGSVKTVGFPFFLRGAIDGVDIVSPDGWRWQAEAFAIDALPYDLNRLIFSVMGEQTISAPAPYFSPETAPRISLTAETFRASIANDRTRGWAFAATIRTAHAETSTGEEFHLENLVCDIAPAPGDANVMTVNLASNGLRRSSSGAKEVAFTRFDFAATLTQFEAFSSENPAAAWRRADGRFKTHALVIETETASLNASGDIGLDAEGFPEGRIDTTIKNPPAFARLLAASGALPEEEAVQVEAALTLAAIANGGVLSGPITLENGKAIIADAKVADLFRLY